MDAKTPHNRTQGPKRPRTSRTRKQNGGITVPSSAAKGATIGNVVSASLNQQTKGHGHAGGHGSIPHSVAGNGTRRQAGGSTMGGVGSGAGSRPSLGSVTAQGGRPSASMQSGAGSLVSRRNFLVGAIGVGAAAVAIGAGATAYSAYEASKPDTSVSCLEVPKSAVSTLDDFSALDSPDTLLTMSGTLDLALGTLVFCNDDDLAVCLVPADTGSPLSTVSVVSLGSATETEVLSEAVGASQGYQIFDVRGTSSGLVWTEANVLDGTWRIYTAKLSQLNLGTPQLVDEGDSTWETPTLAAVDKYAFWQVLPNVSADGTTSNLPESSLRRATMGSNDVETVYTNKRRMGTPVYAAEDGVVITGRADSSTVYYQLTKVDASSGEISHQVTLPATMAPLEAGWGKNGFMWSFENIYNTTDGLSNLGTYTPMTDATDDGYKDAKWFCFGRTPSAAPAWCGNVLMVKSTYSVCGVDLDNKQYCAIDVDNGAAKYGEYLATTGAHQRVVTYTSIDYQPVNADAVQTCRVKIWEPTKTTA